MAYMMSVPNVNLRDREGAPDLWEAHTHPEGALYFRHRHRVSFGVHITSDPLLNTS